MRHRLLDSAARPGQAHHRLAALHQPGTEPPYLADPDPHTDPDPDADTETVPVVDRPPWADPDAPPEPDAPPLPPEPYPPDTSDPSARYRIFEDVPAHPDLDQPTISLAHQGLRRAATRWVEHWVPSGLRGGRLGPGRTGAVALIVVAVLAALAVAIVAWWQRPVAESAPQLPAAGSVAQQVSAHFPTTGRSGKRGKGGNTTDPSPPAAPDATIVVSVIGKVNHPGLVSLPNGSRVADALRAAGDPLPGTDLVGLNLARRLDDGEQLDIGTPSAVDSPPADSGSGTDIGPAPAASGRSSRSAKSGKRRSAGHAGKVNINRAGADDLLGLPGVGPVTAQRIVDWRTQHGRFTSVDQLRTVGGIGQAKFDRLRDSVTL